MTEHIAHLHFCKLLSACAKYRKAEKDAHKHPRYRKVYAQDIAWEAAKASNSTALLAKWLLENPKAETEWKDAALSLVTLWANLRTAWQAAKSATWNDQEALRILREREAELDAFLSQKSTL